MFNLIQNENMKIYRRARTWIMVGILVVLVIVAGILMRSNQSPQQQTAWVFATEVVRGFASLVVVFIVVIAGDIVAVEFSSGTIKALLTQPVSRARILFSKYVAALLFGVFMYLIMFLSMVLVGGTLFGFAGVAYPHVYTDLQGNAVQMATGSFLLLTLALSFVSAIITITIAFMISAVFRSSALAIAISIVTVFIGSTVAQLLFAYSWDKYILFSNMNLMQYVVGGPLIKGMTLGFSIFMLILYFIVLNLLSWGIFMRRDVAA